MNLDFSKRVNLKSGREVLLRYARVEDAEKLVAFINPIVQEPARILLNVLQTLEGEEAYLKDMASNMEKEDALKLFATISVNGIEEIVGVVDVDRGRYKQRHLGTLGLSIRKDFRGEGLGRVLIEEVLMQAKTIMKLEMVTLGVDAENPAAVALYTKMGFQEYGRLPRAILQQGVYEDEILMYRMI